MNKQPLPLIYLRKLHESILLPFKNKVSKHSNAKYSQPLSKFYRPGFINKGNTCYMNALLQASFFPSFKDGGKTCSHEELQNGDFINLKKMGEVEKKLNELLSSVANLTIAVNDISSKLNGVDAKITSVEEKLDAKINSIDTRVKSLEGDFQFYSDSFEEFKRSKDVLNEKCLNLEVENKNMKARMDQMENDFVNEKIIRNKESQYHRSSVNLKILGIPSQPGENSYNNTSNKATVQVVSKLAEVANIAGFESNQIDVCHRLGSDNYGPIIVRFTKKDDRYSFFKQKSKLKDVNMTILGLKEDEQNLEKWRESMSKIISSQDHLTSQNNFLLKLAKTKARSLDYEQPGYFYDGEVRVRKNEHSKYVAIQSTKDISKIV